MKILKEDFAEEQNKSVQKQTDLLNTIKNDPKGVQYVINFIRNELDEDDANDVEVVFKSQNTFDSYSRLLDTIVRDKVIEACEQFINNSTLTESENDEEISVKDALKEIIAKFGNYKYKYKLVAEEYQRYSSGGVYTKTFFAPNDYIALFSMTLHEAPTISNFEDYMDGDELKEYLDEYPTYESLLENASAIWWGDGDDFIISLENLTTGETLYEGGYSGYDEDDDDEYDWDEDLEESVNLMEHEIADSDKITIEYYLNTACAERRRETKQDIENDYIVDSFYFYGQDEAENQYKALQAAVACTRGLINDPDEFDQIDAEDLEELEEMDPYELIEELESADFGFGSTIICKITDSQGGIIFDSGFNKKNLLKYLREDVANPLKDAQDEAKKHQKGKGPFVKLDAGDVEHNTQAFNNAMGSSCEGGACMESFEQTDPNLDDIIDWLFDHKQAFEDFKAEFNPKQNEDGEYVGEGLNKEDVLDWIKEHKQLYEDFKNHFNLNESIEDIEKEEKKIEPQTINIRQALNELDRISENSDFINMYEAANLSLEDKQKLALMLAGQADANEIYDFLASKAGDGYLHSESHVTGDN